MEKIGNMHVLSSNDFIKAPKLNQELNEWIVTEIPGPLTARVEVEYNGIVQIQNVGRHYFKGASFEAIVFKRENSPAA